MEVGIVGKPNVGKSTFFKALTLAEAEIANFPFTTIKANIGVGYARKECACKSLSVECSPNNSICKEGNRFVPVKVIDVAGLVPGAHEGKGLGNQFLDDLRQADVLIHIIDISGRTNEKGEVTDNYDPEKDIKFLEEEIDLWFFGILKKNWKKIYNKAKHSHKDLITELAEQLSGLEVNEEQVGEAAKKSGLSESTDWSDEQLREFATNLRESSKPILIVANKIDLDHGNFDRLRENYNLVPVCSEAELALRQAEKAGIISYLPGDKEFKIIKDVDEKQRKALEFIQNNVLNKYGSTGVQECINTAVFEIIKRIVVYPVENENKFTDNKGNVLPDAHLLPQGSTALDLAYKVHTDIGDKFIGAIDCKTKMKVGKDHQLNDCDVIKIIAGR